MDFVFNYIFAWVSVFLGVFLSAKYLIRKIAGSRLKHKKLFQQWNKSMRRWHVPLGVIMIATGFIHGLFSSQDVFSLNLGTAAWVVGLLIGVSYAARKLLAKKNLWLIIHRILTIVFLFLIIFHVVDVGGIRESSLTDSHSSDRLERKDASARGTAGGSSTLGHDDEDMEDTATISNPESFGNPIALSEAENDTLKKYNENLFGVILKDGVYTGVAVGYRNGLTVEVVISGNQVTNISIISHNEMKEKFYIKPMKEIPLKIIDTQSLDVDAVTGATYTSIGIINAVNDALSQAVISGELPPMRKLP